jgi:hypothetical protein
MRELTRELRGRQRFDCRNIHVHRARKGGHRARPQRRLIQQRYLLLDTAHQHAVELKQRLECHERRVGHE